MSGVINMPEVLSSLIWGCVREVWKWRILRECEKETWTCIRAKSLVSPSSVFLPREIGRRFTSRLPRHFSLSLSERLLVCEKSLNKTVSHLQPSENHASAKNGFFHRKNYPQARCDFEHTFSHNWSNLPLIFRWNGIPLTESLATFQPRYCNILLLARIPEDWISLFLFLSWIESKA